VVPSRPYRLSAHVHACFSGQGAILLDVARDAYFGLDAEQACALATLVEGWPGAQPYPASSAEHRRPAGSAGAPHPPIPPENGRVFAAELRLRGLLTLASEGGRAAMPVALATVQDQLIPWESMSPRHIRINHVLRFVKSALVVATLLRFRSLHYAVTRAARRKAANRSAVESFDCERARELVSAFYYIRVFLYTRTRRCLFDSATLLEFLACYHIYPLWVIGVQVQPFAAHSWVQHGASALNGTPEFVRAYTPILVI
jgi:Transglutaminase-like superfamily